MSWLNSLLRGLFDALLYPFRSLPALVGLSLLALVTAIAMLWVYKKVSNQKGLEAVKRQIAASLFEIRLFNDDFRHILRAQVDILRHNLTYLRLSMVPMIFILPPLVLTVAQLQFHYGYSPVEPGRNTILKVELEKGWETTGSVPTTDSGKPVVELDLPPGLVAETPAVWVPTERTLSWRLRASEDATGDDARGDDARGDGDGDIGVVVGEQRVEKSFHTRRAWVRRSPVRPDRSFLEQLVYPAEPPLPKASPVERIDLDLPPATVNVLGWQVHEMAGVPAWMIVFFLLSVIFAFALRKPFGVQI
jgi:uncharacterized membrane protein (DUF106 family)